jgi:hypothetical protein
MSNLFLERAGQYLAYSTFEKIFKGSHAPHFGRQFDPSN